jgi:5-methyltetrahydropteroyltriglutamate--homocysteine methyltransferase
MSQRSIARAETVGSLLRSPQLLLARRQLSEGSLSQERVRQLEDSAVMEAIRFQEEAGLDVITDGELRRAGWAPTAQAFDGFELRRGGPGLSWHGEGPELVAQGNGYPTIVRRLRPRRSLHQDYAFLAEHARARTKYCLPAPSYHRRNWYAEHSSEAYPTCEDFLLDVRDHLREVVARLVELGCDYIQLDAPNYGSLCDRGHRAFLESHGHDLDAELDFDVRLDSSVFEGLKGVTRALHVCRGNAAGRWHSTGGYDVIADRLFPGLDVDVLLLEYDSDRAGNFAPLASVRPGTVAVLGLVTTKSGVLENEAAIEARIAEAARIKPLVELALSPQCGFASVAAGNPLTPAEQEAKLRLVGRVARRVWGD